MNDLHVSRVLTYLEVMAMVIMRLVGLVSTLHSDLVGYV